LGSLRVFIAVAHHLSFTRAADALGVTASAASLQIRSLEEYLGRALFRRNGREVRLTDEGAALLPRVRQALEQLERAVDDARRDRTAGPLRVSLLASFLQQWLLPRLERFRLAFPEIDLHLHTSDKLVDFVREDFHLAVRFGKGVYPNLHSEKLLGEWVLPVCTPALYERFGPLRAADDLRRYPLLHSVGEPWTTWLFDGHTSEAAARLRWRAWRCRAPAWSWPDGVWSLMKSPAGCWCVPAIGRCAWKTATGWSVRREPKPCPPSGISWTGSGGKPRGSLRLSAESGLIDSGWLRCGGFIFCILIVTI
jgi:DNA-binding transcriptional LysR family regulator